MALLGAVDKSAALIELNNRILRIAEEMGGNPSRIAVTRSLPSPMVAGASGEARSIPSLITKNWVDAGRSAACNLLQNLLSVRLASALNGAVSCARPRLI